MFVIFPAGDISISADDTTSNEYSISVPDTCKNCLIVGVSQSWPEELCKSSESLLMPSREQDCPQLSVDKQETCASDSVKAPLFLPSCCSEGYQTETNYSFHRIKPDLVAPGVNIVSARSDGDPFSGGTDGCRCRAKTSPAGGDTACLVAMTGRFR